MSNILCQAYVDMLGPTVGDKVRLADTELWIEVEGDLTTYGEEVKFGGGKMIHDGMGQGQMLAADCVDLVLTNALIVDHWGIVKADIGVKDGRTFTIGKAGNSDIQPNITTPIGAATKVITAEGEIVIAGGIDTYTHWTCPQQVEEALVSGVIIVVGGGTGPAAGTHATTCTPGPWYIPHILQAVDSLPINIGLLGKGSVSQPDALRGQVVVGVVGLKIHEDWGAMLAAIDRALTVADETDIQVALHGDTLNESGFVENTLAAIGGRTIHIFHTEGAGGGCTPDIITACAHPSILPSPTNPTLPYTLDTIDGHLDMLMVCHHLDPDIVEDVVFARSRIRRETIVAEDMLHGLGAFSLTSSDLQAMGRIGEVVLRTWQAAHRIKVQRGTLAEETGGNDNFRVKRCIAKYTINSMLTHDIAHEVGSIEAGKLADLVVRSPTLFGVRPATVVKGDMIATASMGDINTSIPTPQPVHYRPIFGALGSVHHHYRLTFSSRAAADNGTAKRLNLRSAIAVAEGCRMVQKAGIVHNSLQPSITVDAQTYEVRVDSELITSEPADALSMA